MKLFFLTILILCSTTQSKAQETVLIYLTDKDEVAAEELQHNFTPRALARRKKNNVQYDSRDWPVNEDYITSLNTVGTVTGSSRWLNAVKFETNELAETLLDQFDFIESIQTFSKDAGPSAINKWEIEEAKVLNYGFADTQALQINVDCLHDLGYTGTGVFVAIIDAGFNGMDTIPYFDSLYLENRLIDSFDFVGGGSVYQYSGHGTSVSSTIIAELAGTGPDAYTGTAKDVDIALYVSEDISSETQLEEFNLVAALERCDSMGVDVANISLGYFEFDDSLTNYTYADLNGQTTISAIGVTVAASRGIIVVTSAGNSGPDHITTPADADSVLTVGAIDGFGNYAWFSGVGPSFDGRVKPDVVARGGAAWFIRSDGTLDDGNGTSFSSPILAGAVACLVEANPLSTAQEIIQAVRESASQFTTPDTLTGYGIPDFCLPFVAISELDGAQNIFYPLPADDCLIVESSVLISESVVTVKLVDLSGRTILSSEVNVAGDQIQIDTKLMMEGAYILLIQDARRQQILNQKILVKH